MNIENMEKVIAAIEAAPDKKFNMRTWIYDKSLPIDALPSVWREGEKRALIEFEERGCGTRACVAGWTIVALVPPDERVEPGETAAFAIANRAMDLLGLSGDEMHHLFYGEYARALGKTMEEITKVEAVAEMRRMVAAERAKSGKQP